MSLFTAIDLSKLPVPSFLETPDAEVILARLTDSFLAAYPDYDASTLESEPIQKLLELAAYNETLLRQWIIDQQKEVMLAFASGDGLDQIAARMSVSRLDGESDDSFRSRFLLSMEALSVAGPTGAYLYHAKSASGLVKDVHTASPVPGQVLVTILSTEGDGTASADLLATVKTALSADDVRPLTDQVLVQSAEIVPYTIAASLVILGGVSAQTVLDAAQASAQAYADSAHALGTGATIGGLIAALAVSGVHDVVLSSPVATVGGGSSQAAYCTGISLSHTILGGG